MKYLYFVLFTTILFLGVSNLVYCNSPMALHGQILEIFTAENEIRILVDNETKILKLATDVRVFRKGHLVTLVSARPITENRFQEGLFFFNELDKVNLIIVDYTIEEFSAPSENIVVYYDIFGRVKDLEKFPGFQEGSFGF